MKTQKLGKLVATLLLSLSLAACGADNEEGGAEGGGGDAQASSPAATSPTPEAPTNSVPVPKNGQMNVEEDVEATMYLEATDEDGDTLSYMLNTNGRKGRAVVFSNGRVTYYPNRDAYGTDSFTYLVFDGTVHSKLGTITVNITPVADSREERSIRFENANVEMEAGGYLNTIRAIETVTTITEVIEEDGSVSESETETESTERALFDWSVNSSNATLAPVSVSNMRLTSNTVGVYTVTAQSKADPSVRAHMTITVVPPFIAKPTINSCVWLSGYGGGDHRILLSGASRYRYKASTSSNVSCEGGSLNTSGSILIDGRFNGYDKYVAICAEDAQGNLSEPVIQRLRQQQEAFYQPGLIYDGWCYSN